MQGWNCWKMLGLWATADFLLGGSSLVRVGHWRCELQGHVSLPASALHCLAIRQATFPCLRPFCHNVDHARTKIFDM